MKAIPCKISFPVSGVSIVMSDDALRDVMSALNLSGGLSLEPDSLNADNPRDIRLGFRANRPGMLRNRFAVLNRSDPGVTHWRIQFKEPEPTWAENVLNFGPTDAYVLAHFVDGEPRVTIGWNAEKKTPPISRARLRRQVASSDIDPAIIAAVVAPAPLRVNISIEWMELAFDLPRDVAFTTALAWTEKGYKKSA